ncbi:MAG: hypothetical protein FD171_1054 [Actinobacteria bacterium]|nr:MAG: hypothetical protein FD171_1054 [Actinomycetota bacterium]
MSVQRSSQVLASEQFARQDQLPAAVAACYEAIAIADRDPLAHVLLGHLMLAGDFYDEAIAASTQAIELDPDCAPAYLTLGLAYDRRGGMWDQSVLVWHELAEVAPDLVTAHVQLGEAFAAAAFEEESVDSWKRALELDPKEARAHYNLAIAALKREGMSTALPTFRVAGALDPSQDELFFALLGLPNDDSAIDLSFGKPERQARLISAGTLARSEDFFGATDVLRLMLDENPADADALAIAAYVYLKQEAAHEAMACALRALSFSPDLPTALYTLGVVYSRFPGLATHAARVFVALAKAAPYHSMTHVLLAESLLGLQRFGQAKRAYGAAVRLDPACVRARFGLAAVHLTEGSYAEAQWEMRRAAYYDTKRHGLFWRLYDEYVAGGAV